MNYFNNKYIVLYDKNFCEKDKLLLFIELLGVTIQKHIDSKTNYIVINNKNDILTIKNILNSQIILTIPIFIKLSFIENEDDKNFILQIDKLNNLAKLKNKMIVFSKLTKNVLNKEYLICINKYKNNYYQNDIINSYIKYSYNKKTKLLKLLDKYLNIKSTLYINSYNKLIYSIYKHI